VIVAVKPADAGSVVGEIADAAAKAESDAAEQVFRVGCRWRDNRVSTKTKLPAGSPVIRVMPNAPVVVGGGSQRAGARADSPTADHLKEGLGDLRRGRRRADGARGRKLDAVTAVSGLRACVLLPDGRGPRRRPASPPG